MVYCLLTEKHLPPIHTGCVALGGQGLLLVGDSGAGKSTLAFGCARLGSAPATGTSAPGTTTTTTPNPTTTQTDSRIEGKARMAPTNLHPRASIRRATQGRGRQPCACFLLAEQVVRRICLCTRRVF
ncbi:MAG: hypothetical protein O2795_05130 [Acidobacteria bacterium]|nr:hypothetical protein [Acidobacteriota bacterium]